MLRTTHLFQLIFLSLLMLILSSCKHIARNDGPPDFYVDETKIPNAVPKPEPLAKYGNVKSYAVFGKHYHTMKSSNGYEETGTASWYGTKFHSRKTSSGEPYNMLGMTAAHKTLPLPTYVEVTNLNNQRKVIVKVNDRGPFVSNRLIDLSYVAAKKLGMLGHGTTPVRIKAINPYSYHSAEPFFAGSQKPTSHPVFTHKNHFASIQSHKKNLQSKNHSHLVYLQVGAFRSKFYAKKLQQRLSTLTSAPVVIHAPSTKETLYKVKIGPFNDLASAEKITVRLKNMGIMSNKM
ncbi:MAG: septal ring lytic transglycosylase RlpA family protein [Gammaproteobacteria bacterium]|nr:septal ring lytic transglycosylase RlpA family protein [Gammaproteobacteria bacterium]MCW5582907.1 septal ring lytic transglycosylase RlpA family protein [Gammaproteobacteria bacterium]